MTSVFLTINVKRFRQALILDCISKIENEFRNNNEWNDNLGITIIDIIYTALTEMDKINKNHSVLWVQ